MHLIQEDPPASTHRARPTKWSDVAKSLKDSPGTWFLVGKDLPATTGNYLRTRYGLEARAVGTSADGTRIEKLYARYQLPAEAAEAAESESLPSSPAEELRQKTALLGFDQYQ